MTKTTKLHDRIDWLLAALVTGFFLFLYVSTLAPGLLNGDSAEFQVLSRELGLAHAMGYPIYLLLGKLFSSLPWNELPWRINLLSAASGALGLGCLYLLARHLTSSRWLALAAPLACGLTGIFWRNAIIAEVYTTSMLASNLVLLLVFDWERSRRSWLLLPAGLLGGLGLGIHSMVLLLAPAILLYLLVNRASRRDWTLAVIGVMTGLLILAGSYYWLAANYPLVDNFNSVIQPHLSRYGLEPADLDTPFERALFVATAQQFKGTLFSLPIAQVLTYIRTYFIALYQAVGIGWSLAALIGLAACFLPGEGLAQRWKNGLLLGVALMILILVPANYAIRTGIVVFFLASYSLIALLAVAGLMFIKNLILTPFKLAGRKPTRERKRTGEVILALALCGLVAANFIYRLDPLDRQPAKPVSDTSHIMLADIQWTHYYTSKELVETMVGQIEEGSLVFSDWSQLYPMQYVAILQGVKPGARFIELNPYPGQSRISDTALALIKQSYPLRPIYFTEVVPQLEVDYRFIRTDQEPHLYRLQKK